MRMKSNTKKIAFLSIMFAFMLILAVVEKALPAFPMLPPQFGRIGLPNVIVMYIIFFVGKKDAFFMVILKAIFGLLTRGPMAGFLSLSGGLMSVSIIILLCWIFKDKISFVAISIAGAIGHNIGQLIAAGFIVQNLRLVGFYFPVMIIAGVIFGTLTGVFLKIIMLRLNKNQWSRTMLLGTLVVVLTFSGCTQKQTTANTSAYSRFSQILSLDLFDTLTTLIGYAQSQKEFDYFAGVIYDELKHLSLLFDKFNEHNGINNIRTINNNAGIQPIEVNPCIITLLTSSIEAYHKTGGLVNVALGPVTSIWREYIQAGEETLPSTDALLAANKLTNITDIIIEKANNTVFLRYEGMSLDVGSIGKGFAVERAVQKAVDAGFCAFALHVGGDVRLVGAPRSEGRDAWGVGIMNPENPDEIADVIFATDTAVFTSGDYLRFYTVDGARYHHIIDPRTLMPATVASSATVIYPCGIIAEIFSLAAFILGADDNLIEWAELGLDVIWI